MSASTKKFAMEYSAATQLGADFASLLGYNEQEVLLRCEEQGWKGLTVRRILRGYRAQVARG